MYSPMRARLGPKPSSALAQRSPSRSPAGGGTSMNSMSTSGTGTNGATQSTSTGPNASSSSAYVSPYRSTNGQMTAGTPANGTSGGMLGRSPSNRPPLRGANNTNNNMVTPLKTSALNMSSNNGAADTVGSPTTLASGTPVGSAVKPPSPSTSPLTTSNVSRLATMPQGGAVGLWRVARDGHSPTAQGGEASSVDGRATPQRPSTQDSPAPAYRVGSSGGSPQAFTSIAGRNGTAGRGRGGGSSIPLHMSVDTALLGGLLAEATSPTGPTPGGFGRSNTTATPNRLSAPPPKATASMNGGGARGRGGAGAFSRSASANTALTGPLIGAPAPHPTAHTNPMNANYLIPPLQLPTYKRINAHPYDLVDAFDGANTTHTGGDEGANSQQPMDTVDMRPAYVTVVFDLDETLCNNRLPGKAVLRPGCMELLEGLRAIRDDPSKNCFVEIILWTASMECVAEPVVQRMDPDGTLFNHLIFRDRRWYKESGYTKDLRLLGRDLSHVVIIENSPMSVVLNRKHSILLKDFVGGGSVNYYYGGGPLNTRTSTGSMSDPALFVVKRVLCDWATAVGQQAKEAGPPTGNIAKFDPAFVSIPMPLGIVEFLRDSPDVSNTNEIILTAPIPTAYGNNKTMCGSPARGMPRNGANSFSGSTRVASPWGSVPYRSTSATVGAGGGLRGGR